MPSFNEYYVKCSGIEQFLTGIREEEGTAPLSVYFTPGLSQTEIEEMVPFVLPENIIRTVTNAFSGAVLFIAEDNYLVLPPFPVNDKVVFSGIHTEPLDILLSQDYTIGLVLVHLGTYAVGVCRGKKLVSSKVGTGLVHGRTKKGGSSSARFQRRRQNQAREFLERVCVRAREHLEPFQKSLDYLQYGGPRMTVQQLQKECPFLGQFEDKELPLMDVPPLKQKVLEASVSRLWSSRIIQWSEE
ncbi:MAG: hypothetical protein JW712_01855 [Dehalococcoidales bacterium]|nr:hypothetical protein [Dehalococcoidales bacterium]